MLTTRNYDRIALVLALAGLCLSPARAAASLDSLESSTRSSGTHVEWIPFLAPNGEDETYLRYLQIAGAIQRYPWSLRGFSGNETRRLAAKVGTHPWTRSGAFRATESRASVLPFAAEVRANSAFPYGSNDGPVWAGRGLTASVSAGFALRAGPISAVVAPIAFITQNASFEMLPNGQSGDLRFADAFFPTTVDRPQRFGDKAYGRADPGNSTIRAEVGSVTAGISTANMNWGPMQFHPFVLGNNAPGFLHGFVGTSRPIGVRVGSFHARVIWGRLDQSTYSPVEGGATYFSVSEPGTRRFATGFLALFEPRGVTGLELGVARFFHMPWPRSGVPRSYLWKPFENIVKNGLTGAPEFADPSTSAENQLISGFARWAFPSAGFEMYAEYGREDHSWDKRDFTQEPDHTRSYGLGLRKTFGLGPDRMNGVTFELINFQLPHLARTGRSEGSIYVHSYLRQGHTQRGQLLGADVGVNGAAGSTLRWDRYHPVGYRSIGLNRIVRQETGTFNATGVADPAGSDVLYALEFSEMRRLRRLELTGGLALIHEFNRNFQKDVTGASALIRLRVPIGR